jgi:hypothetical protein
MSNSYNDTTIMKGNRCGCTLGKTKQRNRETDEGIHIVHLLNLVGTRIANLGSGTPTGAGFIIAKQICTDGGKRRLRFRLRSKEINRTVKGGGSNLVARLIVKRRDSGDTLGESQKSNLLRRDANLANGSGSIQSLHVLPRFNVSLLQAPRGD